MGSAPSVCVRELNSAVRPRFKLHNHLGHHLSKSHAKSNDEFAIGVGQRGKHGIGAQTKSGGRTEHCLNLVELDLVDRDWVVVQACHQCRRRKLVSTQATVIPG